MRQIDGHESHHTKTLFYFPDIGMADTKIMFGEEIVCDVWVDITSVIDKKIQAMNQCVSQGYHGSSARKIAEARDGRWGCSVAARMPNHGCAIRHRDFDRYPYVMKISKKRSTPTTYQVTS